MPEEVKVTFFDDGTMQIETSGFVGKRCTEVTGDLEKATGTVRSREYKKEFQAQLINRQQARR